MELIWQIFSQMSVSSDPIKKLFVNEFYTKVFFSFADKKILFPTKKKEPVFLLFALKKVLLRQIDLVYIPTQLF